jgi:23S rRNA pseudouridine2605 synthase
MIEASERLQKILAQAGLGSRRGVEAWIEAGRVRVNGVVAKLGDRATYDDRITVDGKPVAIARIPTQFAKMIVYNKPEGQVCTRRDEKGRNTVFAHLPKVRDSRWVMVGRLDVNTSGLLLFTNRGELAHRLMHPSYEIEREYAVRIVGEVTESITKQLLEGVQLDDGLARFDTIRDVGGEGINHWYHVVLREGKNREVRRMWESQGVTVSRLIRVRYGSIVLPRALRRGAWSFVEKAQLDALAQSVDLNLQTKR